MLAPEKAFGAATQDGSGESRELNCSLENTTLTQE
jgi:hypothetical protein